MEKASEAYLWWNPFPLPGRQDFSGKALSMVGNFQEMLESWKDVELSALIDRILQDTEYEKTFRQREP